MKFGPFEVHVVPGGITVGRGGKSLLLTPGEIDKVSSLIGLVLQVQNFKVLPPRIQTSPFEVRFQEQDGEILCVLGKKGMKETCSFLFREGDDLLNALSGGIKQHVDYITIGSGKRRVIPGRTTPEPPVDGRQ